MEDWEELARKLGFVNEKEMYVKLYHTEGKSTEEIAALCGVTRRCIRKRMIKCGVKLRAVGGANKVNSLFRKDFESDPGILTQPTKRLMEKYNISRWTVYHIRAKYKKGG